VDEGIDLGEQPFNKLLRVTKAATRTIPIVFAGERHIEVEVECHPHHGRAMSLADWLGYGLEEVFADAPEIGIVRKIRPYSGLVRYEAHNDALEWPQALKDTLATEKPKVIVVMLGLNDRQTLRERLGQAPQKSITGQNETATAPSSAEPGRQGSGPGRLARSAAPTGAGCRRRSDRAGLVGARVAQGPYDVARRASCAPLSWASTNSARRPQTNAH
jgi:hypothetical protein